MATIESGAFVFGACIIGGLPWWSGCDLSGEERPYMGGGGATEDMMVLRLVWNR
jgi:hypothetical protein